MEGQYTFLQIRYLLSYPLQLVGQTHSASLKTYPKKYYKKFFRKNIWNEITPGAMGITPEVQRIITN